MIIGPHCIEIIANATGYTPEEVNEFNILLDTFCPSGQLYEEENAIKVLTEKCHLSEADAKAFFTEFMKTVFS